MVSFFYNCVHILSLPQSKAKGKNTAKRGKGSRSGTNARNTGASDGEIEKLPEDVKATAGIKPIGRTTWDPEDEMAALSYILAPERWPNFKVNQKNIFTHVRCFFCCLRMVH